MTRKLKRKKRGCGEKCFDIDSVLAKLEYQELFSKKILLKIDL